MASSRLAPVPDAAPAHRSSLSIIAFAHGASDFYSGIVPLVVYFVVTRDHLSPALQGAITFVWSFTSSIVQPLFGAFSDRSGRWWFLPVAVATTTVAVTAGAVAPNVWWLVLCIVAGGFGSAILHPEAGKYTAMVSGSKRAAGISVFQIGGQVGYSIGPAVAAVVLAKYGGAGLVPVSIFGLFAAALLFARMPHVDRIANAGYVKPAIAPGASSAVDRTGITLIAASTALRFFTGASLATFLPNVLVGAGYSLTVAGTIVSAFLLVSAIGLYAGGALADRFGGVTVSVVTLVASVPCFLGFFALLALGAHYLPLAVGSLMLGNVLLSAQNAPGVALVQAMLPRNLGMALGLMNGVAFGAGSAAVALAGIWVARIGPASTLTAISWAPILAALTFFAVRGRARSASAT